MRMFSKLSPIPHEIFVEFVKEGNTRGFLRNNLTCGECVFGPEKDGYVTKCGVRAGVRIAGCSPACMRFRCNHC